MKTIFKLFMIIALLFTVSACSNEPKYETYKRGEWTEDVYTNEFVGLSFTLPENWIILSDEELIAMIETGVEELDDDSKKTFEQAMELSTTVFDFWISNNETGENVMLSIEDLTKTGSLPVTVEDYKELYVEGLVASLAYNYTVENKEDEILGGETYQVVEVIVEEVAVSKAYIRKVGKYMVGIISFQVIGLENGAADIIEDIKNS